MVIIPPVQQLTLFKVKRPQKPSENCFIIHAPYCENWPSLANNEQYFEFFFTKFVNNRVWTLDLRLPGHIWILIYLLDDPNYSFQSK